ncbi:MAG TPA: amino acid adenylation domain-containing protein [Longimicrobium sp.]|nr:amino acid adenylation domain-containing protein [Longimicrobium sp.]
MAPPAELRDALRRTLPDYMVPSFIVPMDELPLTPNGKVDRRALPEPEYAAGGGYVAPRTRAEREVAEIWAEVMGLEQVGIHDDFFALGGHSLLATRVVARIRQAFDAEVPLRALFEAPTVAGLAALIEGSARAALPPIVPVERDRPLPLSFAQQRLWFLDQFEPGTALYNVPSALRLSGALDVAALERAVGEVVRRHEALRTTFAANGDEPVQVIAPAGDLPLAVEPVDGEEGARARVREESFRPFDLARGPLFRAFLFRIAEDDHVLLVVMHHAVSDGWSLGVLYRELAALYDAFHRGEEPALPPLAVQYADYAVWQREHLAGGEMERQLAWWKERLAGAPALLELPTDRPRAAGLGHDGASEHVVLPPELSEAIHAVARREGATLFMTLLAAYQVLLARCSGQDDVVVGSPIAGRNAAETDGLIGFFVNTLALRTDLSGDPTFRELLQRVRETTLEAYARQDLPFEKLVEEVQPERSLTHAPIYQAFFNLLNDGDATLRLPQVRADRFGVGGAAAKDDLSLGAIERAEGLVLVLAYRTQLFDASTIRRHLAQLRVLLEGIATDADRRISALPLLTDEERETVVHAWNRTESPYAAGPVHALVSEQARRTPDAPAVVQGGEALTFAALEERSNRLANHLVRLGVARGEMVAISMDRSPSLLVAMLAVWKAGAAYVPVDPAYPEDRRAYMLEDSGASVVLTDSASVDAMPATEARAVVVDRIDLSAEDDSALATGVEADDLAYVIYTSGSTGRPKGVMVPHGGVVNFLLSMAREPGIGADDVLVAVTSLSFDIAVLELLLPLLVGAKVVVATREEAMDAARLAELLRSSGATVMQATPATWRMLVQSGWSGDPRLAILSGGEALQVDLARELLPRGRALWNVYGPTETTIWSAVQRVESADAIHLGRPIANTTLYVVDPALNPCPLGVAGELLIGGDGVVRGYLCRPSLTAERFVPDPFSATPGARLYRTGDRVRAVERTDALTHSRTHALEFLGRIDFQVKVRGFRIELGEIESALADHPAVRQAVVVVREDGGDARIVAYLVPGGGAPSSEELRQALAKRLPDYMLPSAYVALEAMPLTPNGKVDRKALPAPEWSGDAETYVAPRTATEQALAGVWEELLGAERVGLNDGFFTLGGHSLRAARLASRVRVVFGVELPLRAVFEHATLGALAAEIDRLRAQGATPLPPLQPVDRDQPLPLSFAQQRLWFIDRLEPGTTQYNMPVALRLAGELDGPALARAVGGLIARHESLRTTFALREGAAVQVIAPAADDYQLPFEDFSTADDPEAAALRRAREEGATPFDLERGPLFRAKLLRVAADRHLLLVNMHHAVSDGWSLNLVFREIAALYDAFSRGEPSPLAPLPVQYADFAAWQRAALAGEALEERLAFWRSALAGAPAVLELPTDHPRPAVQTFRGGREALRLPAEVLESLRALGRREGATLFMTVLAAYQALLGRHAGQDDVVVGTPVAGRTRAETEGVVGFFVNTLALRARLDGDPDFRGLLARVRETTLGALANQDLPFEKLVEEVQPERSMAYSPVFQAFFQLTGAPEEPLRMGGLRADSISADDGSVKFDLSLIADEGADGLGLMFAYNADLFAPSTIRRMLDQLAALLTAAAAEPARRLSELPLLSDEEAERIAAWQAGPALPAGIPLFPEQFALTARRVPDAAAVIHGDRSLTYAELDARSARLANHLRRLGAGPEVRVGLCLPRTPELVVAELAVIRSGGVVVALEPHFPPERIAGVLGDAGASILISTSEVLAPVAVPESCRTLLLDDEALRQAVGAESAEAPAVDIPPQALWAVFYTSGSTGKPKGVMVPHGGLAAYVDWMRRRFPVAEGERVLAATSACFDVHVCEVHHALASGAAMVLVKDALALAELPGDLGLAQAGMVPTAARELLAVGRFPSVSRRVHLGGEAVPPDLARDLYAAGVPSVENLYGPTEDTVFSTHAPLPAGGRVTVGRPVDGRRAYVLDVNLRPVPAGVVGELYLGGCGVTRGYLGRPGLTAERFVPDPQGVAGERMYATGDRARWLPNGELEFLGRIDFQVKVRGFRIEPGEIEAVLRQHPLVRDAVVAARGADTAKRLLAWVVADEGAAPDAAELAAWVRERLPAYMVPTGFGVLPAFPRTATAKVDRRALPEPEHASAGAEYVAPATPTEVIVAEVFAQVLEVERVGATDDFFALGGHSLKGMHAWSYLRDRCGVELPLRALFEHSTVRALARAVDEAPRAPAAAQAVRVTARRRTVRAVRVVQAEDEAAPGSLPAAEQASTAAALEPAAGGDR